MAVFSAHHTSLLARAAVVLSGAGFVLLVLAVSTPYWRSSAGRHEGLWEVCQPAGCRRLYRPDTLTARVVDGVDGWFQAVEVLETVGLILSFGAVVVGVLYACIPPVSSKVSAGWSIVTSLVSGVCVISGNIIYSRDVTNKNNLTLSWSFGLALASSILQFLAAAMLLVAVRRQRNAEES